MEMCCLLQPVITCTCNETDVCFMIMNQHMIVECCIWFVSAIMASIMCHHLILKQNVASQMHHFLHLNHRLCLDVGIGAQTMELESDFLNTDVWMYLELRLGIEDPIPWY